ncbi:MULTISPECIES: MFS transporter [unclassified Streptomyces]|uniref:MFS transporter n=1 Tax=unclassified Streptomyces TaxID=2593676 RepID=UPI000BAC9E66|nr:MULTISPECIES: MFS transporter [unclassified Streptomyces]ASY31644.1 MFS transporter [Streptomyces sp. CLI2509]MYX19072.1 MFS transporter [Streptomyces sp. SID8380]
MTKTAERATTPTTPTPLAPSLDEAPLRPFHLRVTATTFGANFSDGYALGMIGAVLATLTDGWHLSGVWQGLLGASALIGLFFGSLVLGRVGDLIGRQRLYVWNFVLITAASALQLWADGPVPLFVLRVLIGFGLGADYAVGPTMLSEFVPRRLRGVLLGALTVLWTVGYVVAEILGAVWGGDEHAAKLLLATGALPALLVLLLRIGTPESPAWLLSQGRADEAREVARRHLRAEIGPQAEQPPVPQAAFRELFAKGQAVRTWFGFGFYSAQVLPYFAIYTFMPVILAAMKVSDPDAQNITLSLFLLLGGVAGLWFVQRCGRRPFTIVTFGVMTAALALMGALSHAPAWALMTPFLLYTFVMAGASNITQVYPPELYPTHLRATGVGFLNGSSRIASAAGTFVLPVSLEHFGLSVSMYGLAAVLLAGMVLSILWAPETKGSVTAAAH